MITVNRIFLFLLTSFFVSPVLRAADVSVPETMTFCYENQDYLPFISHATDDVVLPGKNGVLPDLIIRAAEKIGTRAVFVTKPWKRCIVHLQSGEVDGTFAAIWQKDRDVWGAFPKHLGQLDGRYKLWQVDYMIYSRIGSPLRWDGRAFQGIQSGVSAPLGYVAEKKLQQLGAKSRASYLPTEGVHLVAKERLDGYVLESSIGDYLIRHEGLDLAVQPLAVPFFSADWYLPLSHQWVRRYPEAAKRFWQALAELRDQDGETLKRHYQRQ